jgi:RNA polymerase sigma factor (sigma-70 family)
MSDLNGDLGSASFEDGGRDMAAIVEAARRGEEEAWNALVTRLTPLVRATARGYRLNERDAEDVCQVVWLRLLENFGQLRESRALPGWVATTARRESIRVARGHARTPLVGALDDGTQVLAGDDSDVDAGLLHAEAVQAVRNGLAELTPAQRDLLLLLAADPPPSYRQISAMLDMPVGSIGPTRARCLARLGATAAVSRYAATGSRAAARRTSAA